MSNANAKTTKAKPVFDEALQVKLFIAICDATENEDHLEDVIDGALAEIFKEYDLTKAQFNSFVSAVQASSSVIIKRSYQYYVDKADKDASLVMEVGQGGYAEEKESLINFRNGVVGGSVLGAAGAVYGKGVSAGTLIGGGIGIVGSWFAGSYLSKHVEGVTDNKYAQVISGVVLGAGIGAGAGYVGGTAQSMLSAKRSPEESNEVVAEEAPLSALSW